LRDGVIVVYCRGPIIFGEESNALRALVKDLLNKSCEIVIDLGGVTYIDSGGLGTLVALYLSARKVGGSVKLASVRGHAYEVLQITKLLTIFEVFPEVQNAIASFAKYAGAA
jgi:anti-sigma B factor antagonist